MNLKKWRKPDVPLLLLAAKITEEASEITTPITDSMIETRPMRYSELCNLIDECDHTIALAQIMRDRAEHLRRQRILSENRNLS